MSRDFQAFHQAFFDESKELLDNAIAIVEKAARGCLTGAQIAELHRCAHGIAGGAAILGFDQPAGLARAIEACLDRYRGGERRLDESVIGFLADGFRLLSVSIAGLHSGNPPSADRVGVMIASLANRGEHPVDPPTATVGESLRSIRFVVSRALAGADIIMDHVLEDLARLGRLVSVTPSSDERDCEWCIAIESGAEDAALADVLDQIAEPGSLHLEHAGVTNPPEAGVVPPAAGGLWNAPGAAADAAVSSSSDASVGPIVDSDARSAPGEDEHVSFWVGDQWFAVAALRILGIDAYRGELRMPGLPLVLLGMLVVSGEPVPLVDAHRALSIDAATPGVDGLAPVLLIETRAGPIGLLVDRVGERLNLHVAQLQRPRALRGLLVGSPVTGFFFVGSGVCACLDPDRLCVFLEGFEADIRPVTETAGMTSRFSSDRSLMQGGRSSAIMAGEDKADRAVARRASARPVVRRSLEEEWQQHQP